MNLLHLALYVTIFVLTLSLSYLALAHWLPAPGRQRLATLVSHPNPPSSAGLPGWVQRFLAPWSAGWREAVTPVLMRLSHWARPQAEGASGDAFASSAIRLQLLQAGFRDATALPVFYGLKAALTFLLPTLAWLAWWTWRSSGPLSNPIMNPLTLALLAASAGYYLPDMALKRLVLHRQNALFQGFPDALDLMRVCVQAGLGLDAAIERVGHEMHVSSPAISQEFALTGLELRAGSSRAAALEHLSLRVGLRDIEALVSMLTQADRFGTSVSESLQVYADALRTQRRLRAEEAAAKLPVKLLIPLVFCIFPALLTVLLGPIAIRFQQHFFTQLPT